MTDNEITKGKELIKMLQEAYNAYYDTSKGMPYNIDEILRESAFCLEDCLNEINRQKAEIERLEQNLQESHIDIREHLAEIERLTIRLRKAEHQLDDAMKMYNTIKAEAYKEFAERLKDTKFKHGNDYMIYAENIDNLLKELVGE